MTERKNLVFKLYWLIIKISRANIVTRVVIDIAAWAYYSIFRKGKRFTFAGHKYYYFYHLYNRTVAGERIVEIPIAKRYLDKAKDKNILEVGNVLSHYFEVSHDILDKYEKAKGVVNKDVVSFKFNKKYDLIISVSTMEHVGFLGDRQIDNSKFIRGVNNLKRHLKKSGLLVVTLPYEFNPHISRLIRQGRMPFRREYFMQRYSFLNEWRQVDKQKALSGERYDEYYANSNVLYIGVYKKS